MNENKKFENLAKICCLDAQQISSDQRENIVNKAKANINLIDQFVERSQIDIPQDPFMPTEVLESVVLNAKQKHQIDNSDHTEESIDFGKFISLKHEIE